MVSVVKTMATVCVITLTNLNQRSSSFTMNLEYWF